MTPEMTVASFRVDIPVETFCAIEAKDKAEERTLFHILDSIEGVSGVEYNGHFGSAIYYTLDADKLDHAPVLAAIQDYTA